MACRFMLRRLLLLLGMRLNHQRPAKSFHNGQKNLGGAWPDRPPPLARQCSSAPLQTAVACCNGSGHRLFREMQPLTVSDPQNRRTVAQAAK